MKYNMDSDWPNHSIRVQKHTIGHLTASRFGHILISASSQTERRTNVQKEALSVVSALRYVGILIIRHELFGEISPSNHCLLKYTLATAFPTHTHTLTGATYSPTLGVLIAQQVKRQSADLAVTSLIPLVAKISNKNGIPVLLFSSTNRTDLIEM